MFVTTMLTQENKKLAKSSWVFLVVTRNGVGYTLSFCFNVGWESCFHKTAAAVDRWNIKQILFTKPTLLIIRRVGVESRLLSSLSSREGALSLS